MTRRHVRTARRGAAMPGSPGTAGRRDDPLFARAILRLYPPRWRDRYGEEFARCWPTWPPGRRGRPGPA